MSVLDISTLVSHAAINGLNGAYGKSDLAFRDVGVVAHIHCLPSVVQLFKALLKLGCRPDSLVVIPKPYSSIRTVLSTLRKLGIFVVPEAKVKHPGWYDRDVHTMLDWGCQRMAEHFRSAALRRLVLIDDGGLLSENWHRDYSGAFPDVVSIQQTASGMSRKPEGSPFRKIDVSRSAAKRHFESLIVTNGVIRKLNDLSILGKHRSVGIAGVGTVGACIARHLLGLGHSVFTYDKIGERQIEGGVACQSAEELISRSTLVLGCTGKNWLSDIAFDDNDLEDRHFISCSSRAVEFQTMLQRSRFMRGRLPFGRLYLSGEQYGRQVIENGGFPINFDRNHEWEASEEIVLTRALILLALHQALRLPQGGKDRGVLKLSTRGQKHLVAAWLKSLGRSSNDFSVTNQQFSSLDWWAEQSAGKEGPLCGSTNSLARDALCLV